MNEGRQNENILRISKTLINAVRFFTEMQKLLWKAIALDFLAE